MFPAVVLVSLLSLVLVLPAAGLECSIYVSRHHGISNTSCWTGGAQTPCANIDLALKGTNILQGKCSNGITLYVSPGSYELTSHPTALLEQQPPPKNNVSIIGIMDNTTCEVVNIYCPSYDSTLKYIVFQCVTVRGCVPYNYIFVYACTGPMKPSPESISNLTLSIQAVDNILLCRDYLECATSTCACCGDATFIATITDNCMNNSFEWDGYLKVCITSINSSIVYECHILDGNLYSVNRCFDDYINAGPIEVSLYIQTIPLSISTTQNITVTATCDTEHYWIFDNVTRTCKYVNPYTPEPPPNQTNIKPEQVCGNAYYIPCIDDDSCSCYDHVTEWYYMNCTSKGVPVNDINTCVECGEYGFLIFIAIEIVPITIMVLLIIIFNIQLTNGSINGVVFYSQSTAIIYSVYFYYYGFPDITPLLNEFLLSQIPCNIFNIFNLDFTQFVYNYFMCISPNVSPLGAISFWYVIGFYPLLLLLLLYVWITLYDKGYKCVVLVTRPFHRCMARFWSMTGIEPSFTHSIASMYILCFTQLAATSFKILSITSIRIRSNHINISHAYFFFDMKQDYFKGVHGAAGFFAILVLLFLIVLPTLYILLYPFKWFHKLLDRLHLRKQLLISLGDVFTGPYKNGTENTYDYRFMAGFYLLARIIILSQFICGGHCFLFSIPIAQTCCLFLLAVIVIIFRPFQRNIHNFFEFILMIIILGIGCTNGFAFYVAMHYFNQDDDGWFIIKVVTHIVIPTLNGLIFVIVIPGYIIYQVYKMIKSCYRYHKRNNPVANRNQEDYQPLVGNDDDWVADRMENPQEYDEQHVPGGMYDVSQEDHEPITIGTTATYGSTNKPTVN